MRFIKFNKVFLFIYILLSSGLLIKSQESNISDLKNLVEESKDYIEAMNNGLKLDSLDKPALALKYFTKAVQTNPNSSMANFCIGKCKIALNDNEGALIALNRAINLDPNYVLAYILRADLLEPKEALKDYNKIIELSPNEDFAYLQKGRIKMDFKDFKGAILEFTKCIEVNPKNSEAYYFRGLCKGKYYDKFGACKDFSMAGELGFTDAYDVIKELCR